MNDKDIIKFWFEEIEEAKWWTKDDSFDQMLRDRFLDIHKIARQSALFDWRSSAQGRLAEILILDQFSRNMFRDTPQAFSQDPLALALAQQAVQLELHKELSPSQRFFILVPYMHSESLKVHDEALKLFDALGNPKSLDFEIKHRNIILQFGRYPHRNSILGRTSTPEEIEFLKGPNSSF